MTATLHPSGQIILTPEANEAPPLQSAEGYEVMVSTSGSIVLRPKRKHQRTLAEHFASMKGLSLDRRKDLIPEPPKL